MSLPAAPLYCPGASIRAKFVVFSIMRPGRVDAFAIGLPADSMSPAAVAEERNYEFMQTKYPDHDQINGIGSVAENTSSFSPGAKTPPRRDEAGRAPDHSPVRYQAFSDDLKFDREASRMRRAKRKKKRQRQQMLFLGGLAVLVVAMTLLLSRCGRHGREAPSVSPSPAVGWSGFWAVFPVPSSPPSATPDVSPSPVVDQTGVYNFSKPVPEAPPVEDSYFSDAVFVGDSRTEGFFLYSGLTGSTSYASKGMNVSAVFSEQTVSQTDGTKISVVDALRKQPDFNKVYIMLGLNELGWVDLDIFQNQYEKLIDTLREIKPSAVVYVQSLLPVSASKDASSSTYNNARVALFNERIKAAALNKKAFFVNVAEAVQDGNGSLPADSTVDGIHLQKLACQQWLSYLKTHTVSSETEMQSQAGSNQSTAPAQIAGAPQPAADLAS